jgi:hypothetical protein
MIEWGGCSLINAQIDCIDALSLAVERDGASLCGRKIRAIILTAQ